MKSFKSRRCQITLPLVGLTTAGGKTVQQLQREITQQYGAKYLQNPNVTVSMKESAGQRVTVDGAVARAGLYPTTAQSTLMQVVAQAGGMNSIADANKIFVFRNAGQVCIATERIFVAESVATRFEDLLVAETAALVLGDGREPGTHVGPMVNARQKAHVLAQIEDAVSHGATVRCGGTAERGGNFVAPTVLTGVTDDMSVARKETFGPWACVTRFADPEEALTRANATRFGLGAVVFGSDPAATQRVARRLQAGMVGINRTPRGVPGTPWVGARESGYGFHKGRDGHRQFTQTRVVTRSCTAR